MHSFSYSYSLAIEHENDYENDYENEYEQDCYKILGDSGLKRHTMSHHPSLSAAAAVAALFVLSLGALAADEGKKAAEPTAAKDAGAKDKDAAAKDTAKPSPQIEQWIKQLDDDQFQVRETATAELAKAGQSAVAPLAKAAAENGLEVTVRAIHILGQLGISDDLTTADAARLALERLSEGSAVAARDGASSALETLDAREASRAMEKVTSYGAYFGQPEYYRTAEAPAAPLVLKQGKWTGGDDGIKALRPLREIQSLSVYCKLTDEAVPNLSKLKHLRMLKLYGTDISEAGLAKLKTALADATIDARGGGQLGISGDPMGVGAQVNNVIPNSAAAKAGVEPGDVINKCDGKAIDKFGSLIELMRPKRPGTKVKLEITRGDKTFEREIALEAWRDLTERDLDDPRKE